MKLIKEDDKLYHFETPDGAFKVVKKGLSKSAQAKVDAIKASSAQKFDDGGDVHPLDPDKTSDYVKAYQPTDTDQKIINAVKHPLDAIADAFYKGGQVPHFAGGTPDGNVGDQTQFDTPLSSDSDAAADDINPGQPVVDRLPASDDQSSAGNNQSLAARAGNWLGENVVAPLARGTKGDLQTLGNGYRDVTQGIHNFDQGIAGGSGLGDPNVQIQAQSSDKPMSAADNAAAAQAAVGGAPPPDSTTTPQQQFPDFSGQLNSLTKDYANQQLSIAKDKANADQANANVMQTYMDNMKAFNDTAAANHAKIDADNDALMKDIASSKIDPKRMINDMSVGSKISSTIGILFGGLGAGANGTNLALGVLQKQIDQDIDSQKANLGKKQTLLSDNFRRLGSMTEAENATRLQMGAMVQGQIQKQAYLTGSQDAMKTAQLANDQFGIQMFPLKNQLATQQAQRALFNNPNIPPLQKMMMMGGKGLPPAMIMQMSRASQLQQQQNNELTQASDLYDKANKDLRDGKSIINSGASDGLSGFLSPIAHANGYKGANQDHFIQKYMPSRTDLTAADQMRRKNNFLQMIKNEHAKAANKLFGGGDGNGMVSGLGDGDE